MTLGLASCPRCHGQGVLILGDVARECACSLEAALEPGRIGLPRSLAHATLERFEAWWWDARLASLRDGAFIVSELQALREMASFQPDDAVLHALVQECDPPGPKDEIWFAKARRAWLPDGYHAFRGWVRDGAIPGPGVAWVIGPGGSGRSSLAAGALKAWGRGRKTSRWYESAGSLGFQIETCFYENRREEGDSQLAGILAPLASAEILCLDDFQDLSGDLRVGRAIDALLRTRQDEGLFTLLVSPGRPADELERWVGHPFQRIELRRSTTLRRLLSAPCVEMVPAIERVLETGP